MSDISKEELIDEILLLINTNDNKKINFNPNYIEYFEVDELIEIRDVLLNKKEQNKTPSRDLIDDIFAKCS
jgi:hypothetical protein